MIYVKAKDLRANDRIYVNGGGPYRIEEVTVGIVNVAVRVPEVKNFPLQQHSLDTEVLIDREPPYPPAPASGLLPGVNYEWEPYTGKRRKVRAILADSNGVSRFVGPWSATSAEAVYELAGAMGTALINEPSAPERGPNWHIRYQRQFGIVCASLMRDHTAVRIGPWCQTDGEAVDALAKVIGQHLDKLT